MDLFDDNIPAPYELPIVTQDELNYILERHSMFLRGQTGGQRAMLQYKDLSDLNFYNHDLSQADFTSSMIIRADLSLGVYQSACFFACDLRDADFSNADLSRSDLRGAYLAGANLTGANLTDSDMREGKMVQKKHKCDFIDRERTGGKGTKTILTGARLKNADLSGCRAMSADFTDTDMSHTEIKNADFRNAIFQGSNLSNADFSGSILTYANMTRAVISNVLFNGVEDFGLDKTACITEDNLGEKINDTDQTLESLILDHELWVKSIGKKGRQLNLGGFDLRDLTDLRFHPLTAIHAAEASFLGLDLSNASMQRAELDSADFRDCYMENIDLRGSSLIKAKLTRADLRGARLSPLKFKHKDGSPLLNRVDLSGADLRFCNLQEADLRDAILVGANLSHANLSGADLRRVDLSGAIIKNACLDNTKIDGTDIDIRDL